MCGGFFSAPKPKGPSAAELAAKKQKETEAERKRKASGRRSLIETSGRGVEEEAGVKKTLLGE